MAGGAIQFPSSGELPVSIRRPPATSPRKAKGQRSVIRWLGVLLVGLLVLGGWPATALAQGAPSPTPTQRPGNQPPTPTRPPAAPPTNTLTPAPKATAPPTNTPAPPPDEAPRGGPARSVISGQITLDANLDGSAGRGDARVSDLVIQISGPGLKTETATQSNGRFVFDKLPAGRYTITPFLPNWLVHRGAAAVAVAVNGSDSARADFYVARREQVTPTPTNTRESTPTPTSTTAPTATETPSATNTPSSDQGVVESGPPGSRQPAAAAAAAAPPPPPRPLVTSLQGLRFAPGRSSPSMVQAVRTDRSLWLGVPFTTQIDGTLYAEVNCGPASVAMVLGAFGVKAAPAYLRDYVNYLSGTFSPDEGTSLYHLGRVVREAGLEVRNLQGQGGYFRWSIPTLRQEIEQGRPVVTLVKYRALPGHERSTVDWDHYIVITGLSGTDFIYNDAAFATERGYGLLISPGDLERAWDYSTLPRHGMAVGLAGGVLPQLPPAPPGIRRPAGEQGEVETVPPIASVRDGWASEELSDEQEGGEVPDEAEFDLFAAFAALSFSRLALEQPPAPDPLTEAGRSLQSPLWQSPAWPSVAPEVESDLVGEWDDALVLEPELLPAEALSSSARHILNPGDPFLWLLLLISVGVVRLTRPG